MGKCYKSNQSNQDPQKCPDINDMGKYEKNYSEEGLFDKIMKVAGKAGREIIYRVLLLYYTLIAPTTPMQAKSIIIGGLGYFILPFDLIPDFIPVAGFADDGAALAAVIKTVSVYITPEIENKAKQKVDSIFGQGNKINK